MRLLIGLLGVGLMAVGCSDSSGDAAPPAVTEGAPEVTSSAPPRSSIVARTSSMPSVSALPRCNGAMFAVGAPAGAGSSGRVLSATLSFSGMQSPTRRALG